MGETGRFRRFHATEIAEIAERSYKLDITWLQDESLETSDDLSDPQDLATEAITALEAIGGDRREILALIEQEEESKPESSGIMLGVIGSRFRQGSLFHGLPSTCSQRSRCFG